MKDNSLNSRIIVVLCLAFISGFLFGYDIGAVSGAMVQIDEIFELTDLLREWFVSSAIIAAAISSIVGGFLADFFGRKLVILISSIFFIVGYLLLATGISILFLFIGRFLVGTAIGLSSMCIPMYIAEIVPFELRGTLVSLNTFLQVLGLISATVVDAIASYNTDSGWRIMFGTGIVPAAIQLMGIFLLPESPRWLIYSKKKLDAQAILFTIRSSPKKVESEIALIENELNSETSRNWFLVLRDMLVDPVTRRILMVGCSLQIFQQLVGMDTVLYYYSTIINMAGVTIDTDAIWISSGHILLYGLCIGVSCLLLDRIGRRIILLISNLAVFASLILLAVAFYLICNSSPKTNYISLVNSTYNFSESCENYSNCHSCISSLKCGFCYDELTVFDSQDNSSFCIPSENVDERYTDLCQSLFNESSGSSMIFSYHSCPSQFSFLALLGLLAYLISIAIGFASIPWTVNSEIYPHWCRSVGNSLTTSFNWSCNLLLSVTFLSLVDAVTPAGAFLIYACCGLFSLLFFFCMLPETRNIPLEEVYLQFTSTFPGQPNLAGYDKLLSSQISGKTQTSTGETLSLDEQNRTGYGTLIK